MKFIVSSTTFLKSLQALNGVLSSSNTLPILDDFLFRAVNDQLEITASDQETTMTVKVEPLKMEDPSEIAIPAKILIDTLKTFPDIPVTFQIDTDSLLIQISAGKADFKLSGHPAIEFPRPPQLDDAVSMSVDPEVLIGGINKTIFATGNDDLRPVMAGIFIQFTPDDTTFVATDAHKLVRYRRTDARSEETVSFIMPRKPLNTLKSILGHIDEPVMIEYNNTNALYRFGNFTLVCRLIDGKYPNYEAVIPRDNPNTLIINRVSLLNALRRTGLYANQSTHQIRFRITGQMLHLSAEDIDFSNNADEELVCEYNGDDMEIGFNSRFMIEMLSNVDSENVRLEMSAPNRAGLILPIDGVSSNEDLLMLVMPVMLN